MTTAVVDKYAVTGWASGPQPFDLTLPSGQTCLVRKLEVPDLIRTGLLDRLDTFFPELLAEEGQKKDTEDDESFLQKIKDPAKFNALEDIINKIAIEVVLTPKLHAVPVPTPDQLAQGITSDTLRIDGLVYVDKIPFGDKMAIFNAVFEGIGDLGQFREGQGDGVGDMEAEPVDAGPSEPVHGV